METAPHSAVRRDGTVRLAHQNAFMGLSARDGLASAIKNHAAFWCAGLGFGRMRLDPERLRRRADVLAHVRPTLGLKPDVAGFTEVWGTKQVETLLDAARKAGLDHYRVSSAFDLPFHGHGDGEWQLFNVLTSRTPLEAAGWAPLENRSRYPAYGVNLLGKPVLYGSMSGVRPKGTGLEIAHGHLPVQDGDTVRMLGEAMGHLRGKVGRVLMGDLNGSQEWLKSVAPQVFEEFQDLATHSPTWAIPSVAPGTGDGWAARKLRKRFSRKIDYLLADRKLESAGSGTIVGTPSDHVGLWADVVPPR